LLLKHLVVRVLNSFCKLCLLYVLESIHAPFPVRGVGILVFLVQRVFSLNETLDPVFLLEVFDDELRLLVHIVAY